MFKYGWWSTDTGDANDSDHAIAADADSDHAISTWWAHLQSSDNSPNTSDNSIQLLTEPGFPDHHPRRYKRTF